VAEVMARLPDQHGVHTLILSLEESSDLDSTALECLQELDARLAQAGVSLVLSRVKDRVRGLLQRCDPNGLGEPGRLQYSVADAVASVLRRNGESAA
jgi:anti-anti-sigma regulatory factor